MKEMTGDLWALAEPGDAVVITTNGDTNKRGWAVMGRGTALQAAKAFEGVGLRERLGWMLMTGGNHCYLVDVPAEFDLVTFPVKHHWHEDASLELIERSARELSEMALVKGWDRVLLPRPGCGNGRLDWTDVEPVIEPHLDDCFWVVNR